MTTSGLQTSKSAATFPRMRQAAPFGARAISLLMVVLLTAPLCATSISYSEEPRAATGELHNRLRVRYQKSGGKLDSQWLNGELANRTELEGSYCDASNYGFCIETSSPPVVLIVYRKRLEFQPRDFYVRSQLATDKSELIYGKFVDERVVYPWAPDLDADARRLREHWLAAHLPFFTHAWWIAFNVWLAISVACLFMPRRRNDRIGSSAAYLGLLGSLCGWMVYATILIDWSLGPKGVMWLILAIGATLGGLCSLAFNPVKTRTQLSLACSVVGLLLPPMFVTGAELLGANPKIGTFLLLLAAALGISLLALFVRHLKARP